MKNFFKNFFFKSELKNMWIVPSPDLVRKGGFSLIELLVAITIGAIILTVVMGSYAAMVKTSLRLDIARQMQKEINFAAIRIADRVRNFSIDLEGSDSETLLTQRNEDVFEFLPIKKELMMNGQPLFSDKISVDSVIFLYPPKENKNLQPWVQIYFKISSYKEPEITNWIRTTISSRVFE